MNQSIIQTNENGKRGASVLIYMQAITPCSSNSMRASCPLAPAHAATAKSWGQRQRGGPAHLPRCRVTLPRPLSLPLSSPLNVASWRRSTTVPPAIHPSLAWRGGASRGQKTGLDRAAKWSWLGARWSELWRCARERSVYRCGPSGSRALDGASTTRTGLY